MDASSRKALRWALLIAGLLGVLCAVAMLLVSLAQFGHATPTLLSIAERLPLWAQWTAAPPGGVPMLIVGALCALFLVTGRWPLRVCAALTAAWFAYAQAAYGPGSNLAKIVAQTFDYTPFWTAALVSVAALLALSVLAIVAAAYPVRMAQARHVVAASHT
jgi:hypothetical protein